MKTHVSRFAIEWAHCDAAGIVFYPYFYIWFDQGTERLFKANRLGYPDLEREFGVSGMPLLETGATYKTACKLGDDVELSSWVDEWADKTFLVVHQINHIDGRQSLEGFERRVWVTPDATTPKGMRAIPISEQVIARFVD